MSTAPLRQAGCALCEGDGGLVVARAGGLRVVRVDDADFPAYYRVILDDHRAEMTDLEPARRRALMEVVAAVEQVLRDALAPAKINLAALGNMVPHLHWHVIARFEWDSHFPQAIWGPRQRAVEPPAAGRLALPLAELDRRVAAAVATAAAAVAGPG